MKIAEIDWPVFWHAWHQQNLSEREHWLARWRFSDDAVRLSMHPEGAEKFKTSERGNQPETARFACQKIGATIYERSDDSRVDRRKKLRGVQSDSYRAPGLPNEACHVSILP